MQIGPYNDHKIIYPITGIIGNNSVAKLFQFSSFYCFLADQSGQVSHALLAIRNARGKIRREQRHNFAPYSKTKQKQKPTCWSVKMVCLSGSKDEHTLHLRRC